MGNQTTQQRAPQPPAQRPQVPASGAGPGSATGGGGAAGPAPQQERPLDAHVIASQVNSALPGYGPGATYLGTKLQQDGVTQSQMTGRAGNAAALYSDMIEAWKNAKGTEELFVKDFGQPDAIAVQKFADIDAEQYFEGNIATAKRGFYTDVFGKIKNAPTQRGRVFPLMQQAARAYGRKGVKIPHEKLGAIGTRAHSLWGLKGALKPTAQTQLKDEVLADMVNASPAFSDVASLLAADPTAEQTAMGKPLYEKMKNNIQTGTNPLDIVDKRRSLKENQGTLWFSPEEIQITASADTDYTDIMTMFALQPEWYPDGCLAVTVDTSGIPALGEARKPTAFDGMMSALWVARNQPDQTFGVTGGGAREYVSAGVRWGAVTSAVPRIISNTYATELQTLANKYNSPRWGGSWTGPPTSAGEEILRGNEPVPAATTQAGQAYRQILGTSGAEQHSPSTVVGQPAPASGSGAGVPGGTMSHSASPSATSGGRGGWVAPASPGVRPGSASGGSPGGGSTGGGSPSGGTLGSTPGSTGSRRP